MIDFLTDEICRAFELRKKFKAKLDTNGCVVCTSHKPNKRGYQALTVKRKKILLHRFIYQIHNGPISDDLVVRHTCDNRQCINPNHLKKGTTSDNVMDRVKRNRSAAGKRHGRSKLRPCDIKRIRALKTISNTELAKRYGVDRRVIYQIKKGLTWKTV